MGQLKGDTATHFSKASFLDSIRPIVGKRLSHGFLGGSFFEDVLDLHPEPWGNDPI